MKKRQELPPYSAQAIWSDEDEAFIATAPEFPNVSAHGSTAAKAVTELQSAIEVVLESLPELGEHAPPPRKLEVRSGQLRLRLPKGLHRELAQLADDDGVSLNQTILGLIERGLGCRLGRTEATANLWTTGAEVMQPAQDVETLTTETGTRVYQLRN